MEGTKPAPESTAEESQEEGQESRAVRLTRSVWADGELEERPLRSENDPVLQLSNPSRLFLILLSGNRGFSVGLIAVASLAQLLLSPS
ncbi:unnamed protein product [Boreogadus saida]